jgi:hypothetical protein
VARCLSVFLKSIVCVVVVLALAAATHSWWLAALGRLLVRNEGRARGCLTVLGKPLPDGRGSVTVALISQGLLSRDRQGAVSVNRKSPNRLSTSRTRVEAAAILADLRRRGVHRFLFATSDYHGARAIRMFTRAAAPDLDIWSVAAPGESFRAAGWWRNREARKILPVEWLKTAANPLGM